MKVVHSDGTGVLQLALELCQNSVSIIIKCGY